MGSLPDFPLLTRIPLAAVLGGALLVNGGATAGADDVDTLITALDEVSQEVSAKNEEVKQLEVDLEVGRDTLLELSDEADEARRVAEAARRAQLEFQGEVDLLAGTKYRGVLRDPITNAMSAENPQNAIDRASYLGALTRNAERTLAGLAESVATAGQAHTDASRAIAEATFQQSDLENTRRELDSERSRLEERIREIEQRVDDLSPADQRRWLEKNNPVEADPAGLDGSESGMAAVQAAMSRLGSPYGWGAAGPNRFDCSGLMYWAYQQQGRTIPRTSQAQLAGGTAVSRAELRPGDLVGYYPGVTHVGMYIGNGQLVHASDYGIPVQVVAVDSMPWAGAVRF